MFSIAGHGHVNPSLDVIRELVARGHRVTYAVPPVFADKVAATGAEPRPWDSVLPLDETPGTFEDGDLIDNIGPFFADARQALPQHLAAYEGDEPDLVLYDAGAFAGRVLARRWGVPAVQLSPSVVAWEGIEEELLRPVAEPLKQTPRGKAFYEETVAWLTEHGVDVTPEHFVIRPDRGIVLVPRALQPQADRVDETRFSFVGACHGERAEEGAWRRPPGAEKVLLVSLGSYFTHRPDFYRACAEAFGDLPGWHVVLQIGRFTDPADLGELPANVEVHSWVPQLAVLRQADAFVTHAGAGGSQEGLATATPMVAVPQAVDQFTNADTLQALGVARVLHTGDVTAESLRAAVLGVTDDPEVARRLAEVQRETAAEGGTPRAADLIEAELPEALRPRR